MNKLSILLISISCLASCQITSKPKQALDINALMQPVPDHAKFIDENYFIWGASMVEGDDGKYHLFYSRWPKKYGHNAWLTHSEIAHAIADNPLGPYKHKDVTLPARGAEFWDGLNTHNPTVHKFNGKYYLYYMGNTGNGKLMKSFNWSHRNNQRIGVAVADNPNGPWQRFDSPLIDVSPNGDAWDALMVSNPSILQKPDGSFLMVYKAVAKKKPLPGGGPVVHLVATSDSPTGPFVKHPDPVFVAKGDRFPAEDPFIWHQNEQYWAIVKDMRGVFTNAGKSLALFTSNDGIDWQKSQKPLVSTLKINWQSGLQKVNHLERPQIWFKNGKPAILFCAADITREHSFNVHIPLLQE
ncbi:sucrase [Saccharobesus litoralis]|uniref:Sucrase n=1 Tax=Saccharobesus litoralis TaxID=2172099 RepID=A0A2S0VLG2_9ALTE|nr:glycoside hydrolase family protein [Saccharobesus litoralis]AWB64950.1 sucrase [Saccharobesus litoralis]